MLPSFSSLKRILLFGILMFSCLALAASGKDAGRILNPEYESWRTSRSRATVVYKLTGAELGADRMEIQLLDPRISSFDYSKRIMAGERLIEESKSRYTLDRNLRYYDPENPAFKDQSFSRTRLTHLGSVFPCVEIRFADGSREIRSQNIPCGGLIMKKNPSGEVIAELIHYSLGQSDSSSLSQIGREKIIPSDSPGASSVAELMKQMGSRRKAGKKKGQSIVIGESTRPRNKEKKSKGPMSYLEEVKSRGGVLSDKFLKKSALMIMGIDRYDTRAVYHMSESNGRQKGLEAQIPRKVQVHFQKYFPPKNPNEAPRGLFTLLMDGKKSQAEIELNQRPYHDMNLFELDPEAVSVLPGSFNCFHVRLVSTSPENVREEERDFLVDRKTDYWISTYKGYQVVIKKIETERKTPRKRPGDKNSQDLTQIRIKKWTLVDLIPPGQ